MRIQLESQFTLNNRNIASQLGSTLIKTLNNHKNQLKKIINTYNQIKPILVKNQLNQHPKDQLS
jgi:hypothetical protein